MKNILTMLGGLLLLSATTAVLTLNDLNDVSTAGASTGDVLTKTGQGWKAAAPGLGSAPLNEILYGTGSGVTSSENYKITGDVVELIAASPATPRMKLTRTGSNGPAIFEMENTVNRWIFYANDDDFLIEPETIDGTFRIRNQAGGTMWETNTSLGRITNPAGTYYRVTGLDTGTKVKLAGFDSSNDLGEITLGAGFSIVGGAITFNYGSGTTNRAAMWNGTTLTDFPLANDGSTTSFTQVTNVKLPTGTTAERGTLRAGAIRTNTTTGQFEGSRDGTTWENFAMADLRDWYIADKDTTFTTLPVRSAITFVATSGAAADYTLTIPAPSATYANTELTMYCLDQSGSFTIQITGGANSMRNQATESTNLTLLQTTSYIFKCMRVAAGSYKWVVISQY